MQQVLRRHRRGGAHVIPIIIRPVDWHDAPFAQLKCLPRDGKPITEWDNQDAAFREITQGLRRVLEQPASPSPIAPRFSPIDQQYRLRVLRGIRTTWIEGLLRIGVSFAT